MPAAGRREPAVAGIGLSACLLGLFLFWGCEGGSDRSLEGKVFAGERPAAAAKVEVYLEAGRFRRTSPFAVAYTDETGRFELKLPKGLYYLVARAEDQDGSRLFGEFPGNPVDLKGKKGQAGLIIPLEPAVSSRDYRGPSDSGIEGRVAVGDGPAAGSYVYVYGSAKEGLMGPGYLTAQPVDEEGRFRVNLAPGLYWVAARRKGAGEKAGFVEQGDATGVYSGNPVKVGKGEFRSLGTIILREADPGRLAEVEERRRREDGGTGLSGVVLNKEGIPVAGLYVILYDHPQMIGRPLSLGVSDEKGRFSLAVSGGGQYFLGARQNRSGPRNPGEMAGGYEGTPDHSVIVEEGRWRGELVVRVEEVW